VADLKTERRQPTPKLASEAMIPTVGFSDGKKICGNSNDAAVV
jgi:hypothetical protein